MATLDDWSAAVGEALATAEAVDPAADRDLVLDLAREVAHGVARPAAPLTAYLVGVAVGRGAEPRAAVGTVVALVRDWAARAEAHPQPPS